jgi:flagellar hook-associated protein 2
MATISLGGLATGLDTETLVQRLLAVEQKPLTMLQTRKVKYQALSTAFQDLNSRLSTLKTRADALRDPATLFARSVTSSDDTVATATATSGTMKGTFTLTAEALARGSIATAGVTKGALTDTVAATDGTFQWKLGPTGAVTSIALTAATTLEDLVTEINEAGGGVRATAVNMGTAAAPAYKLTLTSTGTGAANDIVIVGDGTTLAVASTQTAIDAEFSIAGLGSFTRSTNTATDVIDGVTITLKAASGSTDLAIDYDKTGTQSKLQGLIDTYNDVVRTIDSQTKAVTASDGSVSAGAFSGDVIPRMIRSALAAAMAQSVDGTVATLAEIGVTTQRDGTLALDSATFQSAMDDDPAAVATLIAGTSTEDGIADLLYEKVDAATKSVTGTIAVRRDGLTATIKTIQDQIDRAVARLTTSEQTLRARFAALEQLVARTQQTGNALLSSLTSLGADGD